MLTVGIMRNPRFGRKQKKFKKHSSDSQDFRKIICAAPGWALSADGFRQVGPSGFYVSPASQLVCGSWELVPSDVKPFPALRLSYLLFCQVIRNISFVPSSRSKFLFKKVSFDLGPN